MSLTVTAKSISVNNKVHLWGINVKRDTLGQPLPS
jgi:hypothetical protein